MSATNRTWNKTPMIIQLPHQEKRKGVRTAAAVDFQDPEDTVKDTQVEITNTAMPAWQSVFDLAKAPDLEQFEDDEIPTTFDAFLQKQHKTEVPYGHNHYGNTLYSTVLDAIRDRELEESCQVCPHSQAAVTVILERPQDREKVMDHLGDSDLLTLPLVAADKILVSHLRVAYVRKRGDQRIVS